MTPGTRPIVDCERLHPTLTVSDIQAAVDCYTGKLGFEPGFLWRDPPTFAGVNLGKVQIFLEQGIPNPAGTSVSFIVNDADALFEFHRAMGVDIVLPPEDRDYGIRDYCVRDLDGNRLSFGSYIYSAGPAIEIERVELPVRLEKRLAALLVDLADHKRMSLTSCLEDILLHTNEPLGDGVASPHTRHDLQVIQQLKTKHGIDYDSHGSYRFVERE
jgi:catechol 2,3-dioxygenase-like lactoylglutathione lyase family enzyme